jgi:hypothetical protein
MTEQYGFHPLVELFPRMNPEEIRQLEKSIAEEGLLEPIELYNGMIIDGRHRYNACHKIGVKPIFVEWEPTEGQSLVMHIAARNLQRRHLSTQARAVLADKIASIREDELIAEGKRLGVANRRQLNNSQKRGTSPERDAASMMNVSKSTVEKVKRVRTKAPAIYKKVADGEMSIDAGVRELKAEAINNNPAPLNSLANRVVSSNAVTPIEIQIVDKPSLSYMEAKAKLGTIIELALTMNFDKLVMAASEVELAQLREGMQNVIRTLSDGVAKIDEANQ